MQKKPTFIHYKFNYRTYNCVKSWSCPNGNTPINFPNIFCFCEINLPYHVIIVNIFLYMLFTFYRLHNLASSIKPKTHFVLCIFYNSGLLLITPKCIRNPVPLLHDKIINRKLQRSMMATVLCSK